MLAAVCLLVSCAGINKVTGITRTAPTASGTSPVSPAISDTVSVSGEYYVVDSGGKSGVVDGGGNVILPAEFSQVTVIRYKNDPVVFIAVDGNARIKGHGESKGGLYNASGKRLASGDFREAYPVNDSLMLAADINYNFGALSFSGNVIIPFKYSMACVCGNEIIAVEGKYDAPSRTFNVFDMNGNLIRSRELKSHLMYSGYYAPNGPDLIISDETNTFFGLMNTKFEEILPVEWDQISPAGSGAYIVRNYMGAKAVDINGKALISGNFTDIQPNLDTEGNVTGFSASSFDGVHVFDAGGREVFHNEKYSSISCYNEKFIASDGSGIMHALDNSGNELFPAANYIYWDPVSKVYICGAYTGSDTSRTDASCYSEDGTKIPLPASNSVIPLSSGLFVLFIQQNNDYFYSLYDRSGKELLPPKYSQLQRVDSKDLFIFSKADNNRQRCGLMDMNGKIIIPAKFDSLYSLDGGNLLYAYSGTVHGLVDLNGNWVWNTSDFDKLMD
jgi:hypothetical protein